MPYFSRMISLRCFFAGFTNCAALSGIRRSTPDNTVRGKSKNPRIMTLHKIANACNMAVSERPDFPERNDYSFEDDDDR